MDREFTDRRGRTWEIFTDLSYYDMVCVRAKHDRDFNSPTSFHFATRDQAEAFARLVEIAT